MIQKNCCISLKKKISENDRPSLIIITLMAQKKKKSNLIHISSALYLIIIQLYLTINLIVFSVNPTHPLKPYYDTN